VGNLTTGYAMGKGYIKDPYTYGAGKVYNSLRMVYTIGVSMSTPRDRRLSSGHRFINPRYLGFINPRYLGFINL